MNYEAVELVSSAKGACAVDEGCIIPPLHGAVGKSAAGKKYVVREVIHIGDNIFVALISPAFD
jgi:hypothetical protein